MFISVGIILGAGLAGFLIILAMYVAYVNVLRRNKKKQTQQKKVVINDDSVQVKKTS